MRTYVRIKGRWFHLYRAIDSCGTTIDLVFPNDPSHPQPRVINADIAAFYPADPAAIYEFQEDGVIRKRCSHRRVKHRYNTPGTGPLYG